ncbi:MAG: putative fatty-acid--CoA ligase [Streptosporangiaceae bacterium]|nr:putative fatty-acid--CoA ligase [Streptosporangiaceae bacterium]
MTGPGVPAPSIPVPGVTGEGVVATPEGLRFTGLAPSLGALVRATVDRTPRAEAVVDLASGRRLDYTHLWDAATRVAGGLAEAGVAPGDRVAIRLPNGAEWCLAFLGATLAGAVPVPVNTRLATPEVDYIVKDCGAALTLDDTAPLPEGRPVDRADDDPEALATMFYTSGTTGRPKGAMLSHRALLSAAEQCRRELRLGPAEPTRNLVAAPLFHILACGMQWIPALAAGGAVVIMPAFEVDGWLRAIRDERIDILNGVPAMYWHALRHPDFSALDVSRVRLLSYGAAPTPPAQVRALIEAFPAARLAPGYGLTEAACVTGLDHADVVTHADSVGTAVPATELRLLGPETGQGVGQLLVRGPQLMSGYWGRPDATAGTLAGGWLHTGDLVRVDPAGRVHILDRRTDMINRGGENVYSVEVERALAGHPAVAEVAVVGVPDAMMGQKVGAVVVPRPGKVLEPADLVAYARGVLADFKVPQYVAVRADPLPRNPGGKVDKAVLRSGTAWGPALR